MEKRLYRNSRNKMLGGVLYGLAEYFSIDPVSHPPAFCHIHTYITASDYRVHHPLDSRAGTRRSRWSPTRRKVKSQ